jgi:preprotein translocase subunit SecA
MSDALVLPAPLLYPEKTARRETGIDRMAAAALSHVVARGGSRRAAKLAAVLPLVEAQGQRLRGVSDATLTDMARALSGTLRTQLNIHQHATLAPALALAAEAAGRVLGMRPYPEQILGASAVVRGMAAEMATGEGKTLAATLAASAVALGGLPVHLVTVNRYLAERDAAQMRPLYALLGLSCGLVTEAVPTIRRAAQYRCDITVCTNKDVPFDYMRDRLAMGRARSNLRRKAARIAGTDAFGEAGGMLLRGLHFAIVDEADSVLIDEARTPLILSAELEDDRDLDVFGAALEIAADLREGRHYVLRTQERRAVLLAAGQGVLASLAERGAPWDSYAESERLVVLALTALHMLRRDEHYLVRDGKVELIDEFTGRVMPDRSWSDGLQEMVECREGLTLTPPRMTIARTTYQRFYRRYQHLGGLSGTLSEVAGELWRVYRLPVATIPLHCPDRKIHRGPACFVDDAAKWQAIAGCVASIRARGTPVLIGTRTVAASQRAAAALQTAGIDHVVLNAAQDAAEAQIISQAGEAGIVTVATNMAGRGTDIRLGEGVAANGGLCVVVSEPHEAGRIDRQLAGRCGRQGDHGTVLRFMSLTDPLLEVYLPQFLLRLVALFPGAIRGLSIRLLGRIAQIRAEQLHARMRARLLRVEEWLSDAISFAGEGH